MTDQTEMELTREIDRLKNRLSRNNREIKELRKTKLFLSSLFDGISEEIMVVDQDHTIYDVNRAFLNRCGMNKNDVLGRKCFEIKASSRMPCALNNGECLVEKSLAAGESVEITQSFLDENGEKHEHIIIMYPLMPEDEEKGYFLEIIRDITQYRNLIFKLQRSEKRFKAILDTATDAIISIDEDHRIILFNNAARSIFGYSSQETIGRDLGMLIPGNYGDHRLRITRFLEKGKPDSTRRALSMQGLHKSGKTFPIEISVSMMEMEGDIMLTAIIRDVTEQKQMESKMLQSERLAAVGQAVAHVAHEIKNPLMIIGGFSSQIRSRLECEKDRNKIEMVMDEVMRLERLVANLGDFTKEYRLVKRSVDINTVLADVIKVMSGVCSPDTYMFNEALSKEVKEINCDPDKLKQVFINIISNGLDAMPDGGSITVKTEKIAGGVEIRITDSGSGITDEDLERIFEPFYTTREGGSGLGLAICYKLIEAHGGEIRAVSIPGESTTFIIQLPE